MPNDHSTNYDVLAQITSTSYCYHKIAVRVMQDLSELERVNLPEIDWSLEKHIGVRIRNRRVELGLTQDRLAENLTVSYQQIQKYEQGANRISASRLQALAERMDVPITYFLEDYRSNNQTNSNKPNSTGTHGAYYRSTVELARRFGDIHAAPVRNAIGALVRTVTERQR